MEFFTWDVNPVLLEIFGLKIHWYGALFATAIFSGLQVMKWIFVQEKVKLELLDSGLVYCVVGIIEPNVWSLKQLLSHLLPRYSPMFSQLGS